MDEDFPSLDCAEVLASDEEMLDGHVRIPREEVRILKIQECR